MIEFRLLDTGPLTAAANMALDEIILEEVAERSSPPTVRFLQFRPAAALVGYHQDVNLELRLPYCRENNIHVNRRHTGGGSIFFQESALGWELFGLFGEPPFFGTYESILDRVCRAAAAGMSRLGIDAAFRPRNDIEVHGRKISGTGGMTVTGGFMFQGTVLMENEVERFLKALRVPVEKLKKREIESLLERICFLSDLIDPTPSVDTVKRAIADEFEERFGIRLVRGGLTARERNELENRIEFFESDRWIMSRSRPAYEGEPVRSITQTEAGTMRVHLWPAPGARKVRQALIAGDFFAVPGRLINDLEAALVGRPLTRDALYEAVLSFLNRYDGRMVGIDNEEIADAVGAAADRLKLLSGDFTLAEVNEMFLINVSPEDLWKQRPKWLLLPYCSKNLDCDFRSVPGCDECGLCQIGTCCELARALDMEPVTIQSFEHLMEVLAGRCRDDEGLYVGSCCEAFFSKHQREMAEIRARGVLINLDSTTCYDLGKGTLAYAGAFDNKTSLNMDLIEKTLRRFNGSTR
jgi:lipoate-protein ligase A